MNFRGLVRAVVSMMLIAAPALATSTIDPTQPLTSMPYSSAPIRNNFQAAYNDINALQNCNRGNVAPSAPNSGYCWLDTSAAPSWVYRLYDSITGTWVPIFTIDSTSGTVTAPGLTPAQIVAALGATQVANTAALRLSCVVTAGCPAGDNAFPNGVWRATDGVGSAPPLFYVQDTTAICSADDGGRCVAAAGGGYWLARFPFNQIDIREYGAKLEGSGYSATPIDPAGTYDSTNAINAALATGMNVSVPAGWYHITNQISCAGYGQVIQGIGRTQSLFDVGSDFNMSATSAVSLGMGGSSFQSGCEIRDMGVQFYQSQANTMRSQLVHYPPAITSLSSRNEITNVRLSRCWDGINLPGNFTFIINTLESGCYDQNIYADGQLDFSFLDAVEVWPFGSESGNLNAIFRDGTTKAAFFGRIDGLEVGRIATFTASITVGADNNFVTGQVYNSIQFDGEGGNMTVLGGLVAIGTLKIEDSPNSTYPTPELFVNGPYSNGGGGNATRVTVGSINSITSGTLPVVSVTDGALTINGGIMESSSNSCEVNVSASTDTAVLKMSNVYFGFGTGNRPCTIEQSGTNAIIQLSHITNSGTEQGQFLSIANDNAQNWISDVQADTMNSGPNAPSIVIGFSVAGTSPLGYYDFGDHQFVVTSTPTFTTEGDFDPSGNTVGGFFQLRGDWVDFQLSDQWTNNGYTTATGNFFLQTNMPSSVGITTGDTVALSQLNNVTFLTGQFPCGAYMNGNGQLTSTMCRSAGTVAALNQNNLPASTANISIFAGGRYRIRN